MPMYEVRERHETRVSTTDAESRARFRRYWALASPGVVVIRREALGVIRRDADARSATAASVRRAEPTP